MSDPTMAAPRPAALELIITRKEKRKSRKGTFGIPPPPKFDFDALPDSARLTNDDVAAVLRRSKATVPAWRADPNHPLGPRAWEYIDNKPLLRAGTMRAFMASRTEGGKP